MTCRGRPRRSRSPSAAARKPGKQRGAPGAHLEWNEHPDGTRDVFPAGGCTCGADLSGAADLGVRYSHQVTDLPEAAATTVQYDRHEVECGCGRRHVADPPPEAPGAPGTVTYGLNFQAWCVFLMVMHHVPVERCADILESMSGTRPSDGWVHGLLGRAAKAVAAANKTIRALIILARVICGDETPIRSGPGPRTAKKKYLQVACTSLLTYYFPGDRDLPSFRNFIYSDLHGSVVVHDRYQNYECAARRCCFPDGGERPSIAPPSQRRGEAGGSRLRGSPGKAGAASTKLRWPSTAGWAGRGERDGKVYARNRCRYAS